ncbi:MAG: MFS transporter [Bacillota bacterium]|nr:MFS transporter [Bacillota bacterium]
MAPTNQDRTSARAAAPPPAAAPATAGPRPALEHNMRINTLHGVVSIMGINLIQPFVGIFAVKLGATNYQIALLSSAPAVVSLLAMIPGARLVDRFNRKKRITMYFLLAHRMFFLAMATIPFFTPDRRAAALVAMVALMNLPGAIGNVAWQSFISGIVPASLRPRAFASRNRWMNLVGTVVVLIAGRMLDLMSFPTGYQVGFALAFVFAIGEMAVFSRIDEDAALSLGVAASAGTPGGAGAATLAGTANAATPHEPDAGSTLRGWSPSASGPEPSGPLATLRRTWREVSSHKSFLRYVTASVYFYFAWQIAWPLFTLYQVRVLGANNLWVSILNLANTGGSLVGYGFWANYASRRGNLRTLFAASAGIFVVPVVYAFSRSLYTVAAFNLLTGAIFSGVNLSLFNALLDTTPERHRTSYIAYYSTSVNAAAILAPIAGVALLNRLGFMWAFLIAAAFRMTGSLAFLWIDLLEAKDRVPQGLATHKNVSA